MKAILRSLTHAAIIVAVPVSAVLPDAAMAQRRPAEPDFRQQAMTFGLTAAHAREVYAFIDRNQGYIDNLARENRSNRNALTAVARELGLRNYGASPEVLLRLIETRAADAAKLETEVANLRQLVATLQDARLRTPAEAALDRAEAAYAAGDLDSVTAALADLRVLRQGESEAGFAAWVQAMRASSNFAELRGDLATVDRLADEFSAAMQSRARRDLLLEWQSRFDQAMAWYRRGDKLGDRTALDRAISLLIDHVAGPIINANMPRQLGLTTTALGEAWALRATRRGATDPQAENDFSTAEEAYRQASNQCRIADDMQCMVSAMNGRANLMLELAERGGSERDIHDAIAIFNESILVVPRERAPHDWSRAQNNLGIALQSLGERESGTARLEEAVGAYRAALEERTRDRVPLDWAITQNNLGNALQSLGERESGTARLEEAVGAYRAALEELTRDRVPLDWAMTQNNLGTVLLRLGERESGAARLEEALAAFRFALEERTRDRMPLDWATTQNNLAMALMWLGERENGTARLEDAVAGFRAALEERTRDRVPLDWATTQNNLGIALTMLGERESGPTRLEEAVAAFRAASEERTRSRTPLLWATTQRNLGRRLILLGNRADRAQLFSEALVVLREAQQVLTPEDYPYDWAETSLMIADILGRTAWQIEDKAGMEQAWILANQAAAVARANQFETLFESGRPVAARIANSYRDKGWGDVSTVAVPPVGQ